MPNSTTLFFRPLVAVALVAVAVLAVSAPVYAQERPIKIAVVNLDAVAARSPAGQALNRDLGSFQKQAQAEVDAGNEKIKDIQRQAAEGANSLSELRLSELQKNFENAQIALKRLRDDKQREGQKLQEEGLRKIEAEMKPVFEAIRDEEGFDLILNYVPGVVVMAGERVDITQKVIDRLVASTGN